MYGSLASIAAASARIELMKSSWFSRAARFRLLDRVADRLAHAVEVLGEVGELGGAR